MLQVVLSNVEQEDAVHGVLYLQGKAVATVDAESVESALAGLGELATGRIKRLLNAERNLPHELVG